MLFGRKHGHHRNHNLKGNEQARHQRPGELAVQYALAVFVDAVYLLPLQHPEDEGHEYIPDKRNDEESGGRNMENGDLVALVLGRGRQQLFNVDVKGVGNGPQGVQPRVYLPGFYALDRPHVQAAHFRKGLLRYPFQLPEVDDLFGDGCFVHNISFFTKYPQITALPVTVRTRHLHGNAGFAPPRPRRHLFQAIGLLTNLLYFTQSTFTITPSVCFGYSRGLLGAARYTRRPERRQTETP